jgi:RHS repeat-associated protein
MVYQKIWYYPFGMQTANSWTRENTTGNNFLANGGTELNTTSNLYDLAYRNYDPVLGRMNGVDPMASKYSSLTPYNFSFNDPVTFADPSGADPADYYFYGGYFTYDDWIPQRNLGWQTSLDRSGAGKREFGESLSSFGGGGWGLSWGGMSIDYNVLPDGAHFFGFSNGLLTSHTHLTPSEILGLGSAYNEAFVGGTTGPIISDYTGGARLWQGSNGDYVTSNGGTAMVPYTNITYGSYLANLDKVEKILQTGQFETEAYFTANMGLDFTFVPSPRGLVPVPYYRGSDLAVNIDAGSMILLDTRSSSINGQKTTTIFDNVGKRSVGVSVKGFSAEYKQLLRGPGYSDSQSFSMSYKAFGFEIDSNNNLFIGYMPNFKFSWGMGAEVGYKQGFNFKL